jgi:hypothetical protein
MSLSLSDINATDDEVLFQRLAFALDGLFPPELRDNPDQFYAAVLDAPRGLRAMAGIYDLDVSITLDDLAWHFLKHNDERFLEETLWSLKELEANEAADLFQSALEIARPFLPSIRAIDWQQENPREFLVRTGIQSQVDPLSDRMLEIWRASKFRGLFQYWLCYARKYPERCVRPL